MSCLPIIIPMTRIGLLKKIADPAGTDSWVSRCWDYLAWCLAYSSGVNLPALT